MSISALQHHIRCLFACSRMSLLSTSSFIPFVGTNEDASRCIAIEAATAKATDKATDKSFVRMRVNSAIFSFLLCVSSRIATLMNNKVDLK